MTNIYNSDILISINPTFIDLIFEQKKIYEYRKSIFRKKISTVYVYVTRPISKVINFSFLSESYDLYSFCGRKHAPQNFIYLSESVK